jgi:RNA ligase
LKLTDLFDVDLLNEEIKNGYVRKTLHPTLPLAILNYTEKAAFDRRWNSVTRRCRGLIYRQATGEVIASGPAKFFNYGESSAIQYPLDTPVRVVPKEDGSLGIGWYFEDSAGDDWHWGFSTRGSFMSEQAAHATELVQKNVGDIGHYEIMAESLEWYREHGLTYICEIVYPANKIVMDYKGADKVIPLGTVVNETGLIDWRPCAFNGWDYEITTLADALMLPIPEGKEGYVLDVLDPESGEVVDHLKLKGDWYKMMHAAIFGLTEKRVWEAWSMDASEFFEDLPDELQPWALAVSDRLDEEYSALSAEINAAYDAIFEDVYDYITGLSRKEFAIAVMKDYAHLSGALFACYDGDDAKKTAWIDNKVKPTKHLPFNAHDVQHTPVKEKVAA